MKIINVNYNNDINGDHYEPISLNDEYLIMAGRHRDDRVYIPYAKKIVGVKRVY